MATPDTPKYHKVSKQVLLRYQEQVRILHEFLRVEAEIYDSILLNS